MAKISYQKAQDVISECQKNMASWYGYWDQNITTFRDDRGFYFGMQWDEFVQEEYKQKKKPTLVIDVLGPFIRKMMGEQKNADVMPQGIPLTDDIPQEKVDIINGLLKRITYDNHASQEFAKAYETTLTGGWGVIKVFTEYNDEHSFEQRIKIEAASEPRNVFFDPLAKLANKQDSNFCGAFEMMSKDDFKARYPDAQFPDAAVLPTTAPLTIPVTADMATVIEYYVKEFKHKILIELSNGVDFKKTCYAEQKDKIEAEYFAEMEMKGTPIETIPPLVESNRRHTEVAKIKCYKLTSLEVLEVFDWYSKEMPFTYIDGDSVYLDGRQYTRSLVTNGKDAQRLYNYAMSEIAHGLKTSRREKIMMTERQIEGYEDMYRYPDRIQGALLYKPDPGAVGPPIPLPNQDVSQSFFIAAERAQADVSKALGMLDPVTGLLPRGASGVAVGRTIAQQNLTVVNYIQNLNSGIEQVGRIVLDLLPKIYDNERIISIMTPGRDIKRVHINKAGEDGNIENDMQELVDGIFDVQIDASSSFAAQKELSMNFLMKIGENPQVLPLIADLMARELDLTISPILEERLSYLVPDFVKKGDPKPTPQPPPMDPVKQAEIQLKREELQEKFQNNAVKHVEAMQSLSLKEQDIQMEGDKAQLASATETGTAKINATAEMMKYLHDVELAKTKVGEISRK